jgi:undecaprenyl-diphosphatase
MTASQAAILGVVEGLTEYLPVSSTGHLLLTEHLMHIGGSGEAKQAADAYAIAIQAGAILAVIGLYFAHMWRMLMGLLGRDREGRTLLINVMLAFTPAVVIGLTFHDLIKEVLFGIKPVVIAWFVGGLVILLLEIKQPRRMREGSTTLYDMTWRQALTIGIAQCAAMWPGTSRSLATIIGGRLSGLTLQTAVIFSFILGGVTLGASTAYDTMKNGALMIEHFGLMNLLIGFAVSFVTAAFAVKWMVAYLNRHSLALFGYYRIALAIAVLLFIV